MVYAHLKSHDCTWQIDGLCNYLQKCSSINSGPKWLVWKHNAWHDAMHGASHDCNDAIHIWDGVGAIV